jgi:AraC-like DNA-binding protein/mannose-6-phosphate isomerase-like protein (cupin superfamily)
MDRLNRQSEDSLSKLLRLVNVHSSVYCLSDFRAPWGFHVDDSAVAKFHLTLDGRGVVMLDSGERANLEPGELIVLPVGTGHTVRDRSRRSEVPSLDSILTEQPPNLGRLQYGGRGRRTRLLCGGFALSGALPARLLATLPSILKLDAATVSGSGLAGLLDVLRGEADDAQPGATAIFAKAADVFLTQALRRFLLNAERAGVLQIGPLQHPAIARAIELMRSRLDEPWTVSRLANEVGMSRTLFVARFHSLVGQPPIRFLSRLRLSQAAGRLTATDETVYAIARRAGYDTEASFSKAFKREFRLSPGAYRRQSVERPVVIEREAVAPTSCERRVE